MMDEMNIHIACILNHHDDNITVGSIDCAHLIYLEMNSFDMNSLC